MRTTTCERARVYGMRVAQSRRVGTWCPDNGERPRFVIVAAIF
jgi:hypothetical protein